jgi:hypothetical protein
VARSLKLEDVDMKFLFFQFRGYRMRTLTQVLPSNRRGKWRTADRHTTSRDAEVAMLPSLTRFIKPAITRRLHNLSFIPYHFNSPKTKISIVLTPSAVVFHHNLRRRLSEERANGSLSVRRQALQQLLRVQTSILHQFARGVDDALRHVALQGFGFEGVGDVVEALGCFGVHGGVGSEMC